MDKKLICLFPVSLLKPILIPVASILKITHFNKLKWIFSLLILCLGVYRPAAQSELNDNGAFHDLDFEGSAQDFIIPNNVTYDAIIFKLRGGDGGYAKAGSDCFSAGGDGATAEITALIGEGPGRLPKGALIRFIVGEHGQSSDVAGTLPAFGGGGGGTAVLAKINGGWKILAVAGGGGGAYQGNVFGGCVDSQKGQGGRADSDGGNGEGSYAGSGGFDGDGGAGGGDIGDGDLSGGGGGAFSDGEGGSCKEGKKGYPSGGDGGCLDFSNIAGGWGFGGGGAAKLCGGGGGGYSGGGGGGTINNGGGGGSYVNPQYAYQGSISSGGNDSETLHGGLDYKFINLPCEVEITDVEIVRELCKEGGRARIQVSTNLDAGDACSNQFSLTLDPVNGWVDQGDGYFGFVAEGSYSVNLTYDATGFIFDSYSLDIEIGDDTPPVALCKAVEVKLRDGVYNNDDFAELINDGSYDNCESISLSSSRTGFNCADVGKLNLATLTVSDDYGNSDSCTTTVTVVNPDEQTPTASCIASKTLTLIEGQADITIADIDDGSIVGPCAEAIQINKTSFRCEDVGDHIVTLTVPDGSDNPPVCTTTVTVVEEFLRPTCKSSESIPPLALDVNGTATLTVSDIDDGTPNDCSHFALSLSKSNFDCNDVGVKTITLRSTNEAGDAKTCSTTVTIIDDSAPTALCKDLVLTLDETGKASLTIADIDAGSSDNCSFSLSLDQSSFGCGDVGAQTVTLTATDVNGGQADCQANITLEDSMPPVLRCIEEAEVSLGSSGLALADYLSYVEEFSDNCQISGLITSGSFTFRCSQQGVNDLTIVGFDINGNSSTCTVKVTVKDQIAPVPDVAILPDAVGGCAVNLSPPTAADNCADEVIATTADPTSFTEQGTYTVTWTYDDGNGNASEQLQTVIVDDVTAPRPDISELPDAAGDCEVSLSAPTATDACSGQIIGTTADPTHFIEQGTYTVAWIYEDDYGNTSEQLQTVIVNDATAPNAICRDITIELDGQGLATVAPADIDAGSIDACSSVNLTLNATNFSCDQVGGGNIVTLSATDAKGNVGTCTANVTVEDLTAPSFALAAAAKLWPPDYAYQTFAIEDMVEDLADNCGQSLSLADVWIDRVSSDEAEDDPGTEDGNTLNDIVVEADCRSVQVRRERMGGGNGRVYTVALAARDARGNVGYVNYKIQAPKWAWGWGSDAVEDAPLYEATGNCGVGAAALASPVSWETPGASTSKQPQLSESDLTVYPNPFSAETTIRWRLSAAVAVHIEVFDIQGRRVRRLLSQNLDAGEYQFVWDGTNASGRRLGAGLYLLRMKMGEKAVVKKVSLQGL